MKKSRLGGAAAVSRLLLAGCLAAWLAGCAGQGPNASAPADVVTASDEPEARKRARVRVELASGYFEEGKNTVALDEVKQALAFDPTYADAFNLRGLIYMRLNEPRLAEDSFRRAIALNGRDANILHNLGWLQCTLQRYAEADQSFAQALANPAYAERPRTLMTQGVCQIRAGRLADAERTFTRAYELDAANPVTGYNLADLLFKRGEYERAQFYIRRLNNTTFANAQTLWLGIKVERQMQNREAMLQLADQLRRRFSQSKEMALYDRGAFNE